MSGSINYLTTLFSASFGAGDPLLNALYGSGGSSTQNPVAALQSAEQNQAQDIKATGAQPAVQLAIKQFTQAVNSATSVTQMLSNPAVMNVLLTANGMSDQIGYTALATKALTSNLSDPNSLANQLTDTRWKTLARPITSPPTDCPPSRTPRPSPRSLRPTPRQPGKPMRTASPRAWPTHWRLRPRPQLNLRRSDPRQSHASHSGHHRVGDPRTDAFQDITAQENAITTRLDIKKLQDPKFVETFAQQYLIANSGSTSASSTPDLTTLSVMGQGLLA